MLCSGFIFMYLYYSAFCLVWFGTFRVLPWQPIKVVRIFFYIVALILVLSLFFFFPHHILHFISYCCLFFSISCCFAFWFIIWNKNISGDEESPACFAWYLLSSDTDIYYKLWTDVWVMWFKVICWIPEFSAEHWLLLRLYCLKLKRLSVMWKRKWEDYSEFDMRRKHIRTK